MSNWTVSITQPWTTGITQEWTPSRLVFVPWEAIVRVWEAITDVTWDNWING